MSGKERSLMQLIWKNFVASLKPRYARDKLIGEDFYGTKYYEATGSSVSVKRKRGRYFVPVNKDDFDQEIPAEWESWLRYRRTEAPTKTEVEENYHIAMTKKKNAAELEAKYSETRVKRLDVPVEKRGAESFPTYEEYKDYGQGYKGKPRW